MKTQTKLMAVVLSMGMLLGPTTLATAATQGARRPSEVPNGEEARVAKVIDGQTIEVTMVSSGAKATVRYIGIDAPTGSACYSAQATNANAGLVAGKRVVLEKDTLETDANGALLRYVYLLDGRMVNEELAGKGFAQTVVVQPNLKNQSSINVFGQAAAKTKQGAWRACGWKLPVTGDCTLLQVETLITRVAVLPELTLLSDGACVKINKAANPAGGQWGGEFVFHPKGSTVKLSNMYVRWKDGFTLVTQESDNKFVAHIDVTYGPKFNPPSAPGQRPSITPGSTQSRVAELVRDANDSSIVRIQESTWLFKDAGNGEFTALVDVFTYKSGDLRLPVIAKDGNVQ